MEHMTQGESLDQINDLDFSNHGDNTREAQKRIQIPKMIYFSNQGRPSIIFHQIFTYDTLESFSKK